MKIIASIALLSACPCVRLAAVPLTFSEIALNAAGPKGPLQGTLLTQMQNQPLLFLSFQAPGRPIGMETTRLV